MEVSSKSSILWATSVAERMVFGEGDIVAIGFVQGTSGWRGGGAECYGCDEVLCFGMICGSRHRMMRYAYHLKKRGSLQNLQDLQIVTRVSRQFVWYHYNTESGAVRCCTPFRTIVTLKLSYCVYLLTQDAYICS